MDQVIDQVRNQEEPLPPPSSENGLQGDPRQIRSTSRDDHGKSANARQALLDRESGMSLDAFPNRSMEEGGVSGLFRRESGQTGGSATGADTPSTPSSSGSVELSASPMNDALLHAARAVTICPFTPGRAGDEGLGEHRPPSPVALDRIDELLENVTRAWADVPSGTVAQTQASEGDEDEMLTGNRETNTTALRQMGHAEGHPASVSPTPSDSSIAETVFNIRRAEAGRFLSSLGCRTTTTTTTTRRRSSAGCVGSWRSIRPGWG